MGTFNPNSIPGIDTTKKPPRSSTSNVKKDTGRESASRSTGFSNRGEPVWVSGVVTVTNNGMFKLLSNEDIQTLISIKNMGELTEAQAVAVEKVKTARSEISTHTDMSDETIMSIIETFKDNSLHGRMFQDTIKSN